MEGTEYLKWIIACGGWIVAIFTVWIGYRERRDARDEDALHEALSYFTGGTQKRSVGIAFLEGRFRSEPRFQNIWVPVIANQFTYLLVETDSNDEAHEKRNLVRLMRLLVSIEDFSERFPDVSNDVRDAIVIKQEGEQKGLSVSSMALDSWAKSFG